MIVNGHELPENQEFRITLDNESGMTTREPSVYANSKVAAGDYGDVAHKLVCDGPKYYGTIANGLSFADTVALLPAHLQNFRRF